MKKQFNSAAEIRAYETKLANSIEDILWSYQSALKDVEWTKKTYGPNGPSIQGAQDSFNRLVDRTSQPFTDSQRSDFYAALRDSDAEFFAAMRMLRPAAKREELEKAVKEATGHVRAMQSARLPLKKKYVKENGINRRLLKVFKAAQQPAAGEHGLYTAIRAVAREKNYSLKL